MQVGPFRIVEEIARGGMGVVHRALGPDGRPVALKLLHANRVEQTRALQRFQLEAQALARLKHPNVVSILGAGHHQGNPWIALEYVEGQSLEERLRTGPLSIEETLALAHQLAQALVYVHACGLLHRDLKPGNVLLRGDKALLTDFGLVLDDENPLTRFTRTGSFHGTPGYWAPEQARGEKAALTPATDVYGLGGVLYACLTGEPPVQADSLQGYFEPSSFRAIRPPQQLRPEVPSWLSELCMRCLAFEPERRPASPTAVAATLMAGGSGAAPPSEGRSGVLLASAGAVLVVAALVGVGWWTLGSSATATEDPPEPAPEPVAGAVDEPSAADREQAQAHVAAGQEHHDAQRYARAFTEFGLALELEPELAEGYLGRAEAERMLDLLPEAIADYERALERDPALVRAYAGRGDVLRLQGEVEEALIAYERALELEPGLARALVGRGGTRLALGMHEGALDDFDRALELGLPSTVAAEVRQARAQAAAASSPEGPVSEERRREAEALFRALQPKMRARQFAEVLEGLERVLELDPGYVRAYRMRGVVKDQQGHPEEAMAEDERAIELAPDDPIGYAQRGEGLSKLERYEEALADFDRALELGVESTNRLAFMRIRMQRDRALRALGKSGSAPSGQAQELFKAGVDKLVQGRLEDAVADFSRAIALDESFLPAYLQRGDCLSLLGRQAEAIEDYSRLLEAKPGGKELWLKRGVARGAIGQYEEALSDFDRALELDPRQGVVYRLRAGIKAAVEREEEALEDFARALELDPRDVASLCARALALAQLERFEEAEADLERALEIAPRNAQAHAYLGGLRHAQERDAEALVELDRALELNPEQVNAHVFRGETLAASGRHAEALASFDRALELSVIPNQLETIRALRAETAAKLEDE